jgi:hypothetical protein
MVILFELKNVHAWALGGRMASKASPSTADFFFSFFSEEMKIEKDIPNINTKN